MRHRRLLTLVLTACVLGPCVGRAQAPWTVTVTPTLDPLPVGLCGAVQLRVVDASGEVPRNARGTRVTMADFDMTVSGASVAGRQIDATHFEVCGCQGGAAGTTATVTATYPARSLAEDARVRGVAFQESARFTLAAAKGTLEPPACRASANTAVLTPVPDAAPRTAPAPAYVPGPVTVTFDLHATGSWYQPGPVTVSMNLNAEGSWYVPGPVTITFDLSATGNWLERGTAPAGPIQTTPGR
jgi:hypothetical protein